MHGNPQVFTPARGRHTSPALITPWAGEEIGAVGTTDHPSSACTRLTLAYAAAVPFDIIALPFGLSITVPIGLLLVTAWIADKWQKRSPVDFPGGMAILLYLYLTWVWASSTWSYDALTSAVGASTMAQQFALVIVLADTLAPVWRAALALLASASAALALILLLNPTGEHVGRAQVAGTDENITAMALAVGFAAALYSLQHARGRLFFGFSVLLVIVASATFATGSRTGVLAIGGVLLVAFVLQLRAAVHSFPLLLRTLCLTGILVTGFVALSENNRIPARVDNVLSDAISGDPSRESIVALFLQTSQDWAIWGVGFGADAAYLEDAHGVYLNAHSLFWNAWIELGVIGLAILLLIIGNAIVRGASAPSRSATLLLAIPLVGFAVSLGGSESNIFWFVVALALIRTERSSASSGG